MALPYQDIDIKHFASNIISDLPNNWVLLLNKRTSNFLFWHEDKVELIRFNEVSSICGLKGKRSCKILLDQTGKFYELKLNDQSGWY